MPHQPARNLRRAPLAHRQGREAHSHTHGDPEGCSRLTGAPPGGSALPMGPARVPGAAGLRWALTGGLARASSGGGGSGSSSSSRSRGARGAAQWSQAARAIRPGAAGPAGPRRAAAPYSLCPAPGPPRARPPPPFVLNSRGRRPPPGWGRWPRRGWIGRVWGLRHGERESERSRVSLLPIPIPPLLDVSSFGRVFLVA